MSRWDGNEGARRRELFENDRNQERFGVPLRCVGEGLISRERRTLNIVPKDVADLDTMGQRLDVGGVEFLKLGDEIHDPVELARERVEFVGLQAESGEQSDFGDLFARQSHRGKRLEGAGPENPGILPDSWNIFKVRVSLRKN